MSHPLSLKMEYPEKLSRGLLILRVLFGWIYVLIPHGFMLGFYGFAVYFVQMIGYLCVLFTGKYPRGLFDFVLGYMRWGNRVSAYMLCLTDVYPPFTGSEEGSTASTASKGPKGYKGQYI